jgi:dUTP pyrophosphatase
VKYVSPEELGYATVGAAGIDLVATSGGVCRAGQTIRIHTDSIFEIPSGHVGLIRGRSGLAFKHGVWCFEGTIDCDYRGPVAVLLANMSRLDYGFRVGDRVAQMVVVPYVQTTLKRVLSVSDTKRGAAGFGSTGH